MNDIWFRLESLAVAVPADNYDHRPNVIRRFNLHCQIQNSDIRDESSHHRDYASCGFEFYGVRLSGRIRPVRTVSRNVLTSANRLALALQDTVRGEWVFVIEPAESHYWSNCYRQLVIYLTPYVIVFSRLQNFPVYSPVHCVTRTILGGPSFLSFKQGLNNDPCMCISLTCKSSKVYSVGQCLPSDIWCRPCHICSLPLSVSAAFFDNCHRCSHCHFRIR